MNHIRNIFHLINFSTAFNLSIFASLKQLSLYLFIYLALIFLIVIASRTKCASIIVNVAPSQRWNNPWMPIRENHVQLSPGSPCSYRNACRSNRRQRHPAWATARAARSRPARRQAVAVVWAADCPPWRRRVWCVPHACSGPVCPQSDRHAWRRRLPGFPSCTRASRSQRRHPGAVAAGAAPAAGRSRRNESVACRWWWSRPRRTRCPQSRSPRLSQRRLVESRAAASQPKSQSTLTQQSTLVELGSVCPCIEC